MFEKKCFNILNKLLVTSMLGCDCNTKPGLGPDLKCTLTIYLAVIAGCLQASYI